MVEHRSAQHPRSKPTPDRARRRARRLGDTRPNFSGPLIAWGIAVTSCAIADPDAAGEGTTTGVGQTGTSGSTSLSGDTGSDGGACPPGTEGCPCASDGLCSGNLLCASQVCVDIGGTDGADEGATAKPMDDGGSDETGGGTTTGSEPGSCAGNCFGSSPHHGGLCFCDPTCAASSSCCPDYGSACPGQCQYNEDCGAEEVCNAAQECVFAWGQVYEVCVDMWLDQSPTCWDVDDCLADVYYEILDGGDVVYTSPSHDDVVSTNWRECHMMDLNANITDATQSNKSWAIVFYDEDVGADDGINTVCNVVDGSCSYLPLSYLKEGMVSWLSGPGYPYSVWVRFVAQ